MPITVTCDCGKSFKVKDEVLGTLIKCQVCGKDVKAEERVGSPVPMFAQSPVLSPTPPATGMMTCPQCAEQISLNSTKCRFCGEKINVVMESSEREQLIQRCLAGLDTHFSNPSARAADEALKGKKHSVKTFVAIGFVALGVLLLIAGMATRNGEGFIGIGILDLVISGICLGLSLSNDHKANNIQNADKPEIAFRRFFDSVRTGRTNKAYVALDIAARTVGPVDTVKFDNPKFGTATGRFAIVDPQSFTAYWKSVITGPSGQTRSVELKSVKSLRVDKDTAVVEARFEFSTYPSWIIFTFLISWLVCLILILAMKAKETKVVRKLVFRRGGKWFIAEGEFSGSMDNLEMD